MRAATILQALDVSVDVVCPTNAADRPLTVVCLASEPPMLFRAFAKPLNEIVRHYCCFRGMELQCDRH